MVFLPFLTDGGADRHPILGSQSPLPHLHSVVGTRVFVVGDHPLVGRQYLIGGEGERGEPAAVGGVVKGEVGEEGKVLPGVGDIIACSILHHCVAEITESIASDGAPERQGKPIGEQVTSPLDQPLSLIGHYVEASR